MPSSIHSPGVTWHSVRSLTSGSMSGVSTSIVFCQNVPASTVNSPARTPAPSSPSWVSAPPATTGVPGRRPVCAGGLRGDRADRRARVGHRRQHPGGRPQISAISADQARRARLNMPELEPHDGSVTWTLASR